MQFRDIVGQAEIKKRLIKSVAEKRIPHALLYTGSEGVGKLALAIAYAQYINCQNPGEDDSCNTCPSCHKFNKLIHPDLHFAFPINAPSSTGSSDDEKNSSPKFCDAYLPQWREMIQSNPYFSEQDWYDEIGIENKQGIISTAESSEVLKKLSLKSFEAEYKVMIIWLPERMHIYGANKLLKLIEEPPAKTLFILISESPNLLLKTILSRTQIISIPPVKREDIAVALVDKYQVSPTKANEISRISGGNVNNAVSLASIEGDDEYFLKFRELMRDCYKNEVLKILNWIDDVASIGRERQKEMLSYFQRLVRESFMLNLNLDDISYLSGEESVFGKNFSPFINPQNVFLIYNEINSAFDHISRNGNPNIIFTDMSLKIIKLIGKK